MAFDTPKKGEEFRAPKTIDEAEQRIRVLWEDIQDTKLRLTDTNRIDKVTQKRLGPLEYGEWRRKTIYALNMKEREYKNLKAWISRLKQHPDRTRYLSQLEEVAKAAAKIDPAAVTNSAWVTLREALTALKDAGYPHI